MTNTPLSFDISDTPPASSADAPQKRGPGRPRGSSNAKKPAAGSTDQKTLTQALATMDSLYDLASGGLMLIGLPATAQSWVEQAERLKASNKETLKASPKLAASIANAGSVGGATTFFVAHAMALGTVAMIARQELALRRAQYDAEAEAARAADDDPTRIP